MTSKIAHLEHELYVASGVGILQSQPERLLLRLHHPAPAHVDAADLSRELMRVRKGDEWGE